MQMETIVRYYDMPIKMARTPNTHNTNAGKNVGQQTLLLLLVGMQSGRVTLLQKMV